LERYQRKLLSSYGADPLITDDAPRTERTAARFVNNLHQNGHRGSYEPFLNEISLHDSAPDPRGSSDTPPMF